jgi:hypothetical protein
LDRHECSLASRDERDQCGDAHRQAFSRQVRDARRESVRVEK